MTPDEALETFCVQGFSHPDGQIRCVASDCMAWRWSRVKETKTYLEAVQEMMMDFKANNSGRNMTFATASSKVFENWKLFHETEGYCGLAGKPEIGKE